MSTIVFLHAHPDDEASQTAGAMARAAAEGHRVVVVFATNGEHGEVPEDLRAGETLAERRRAEAECSAAALGVSDVRWLGYADSGMTGWAQNADPSSFLAAPTHEAARRLADILDAVDADVLVGYDWHGGYGHPDHVTVHQVVHAAAPMASRTPRLYEATMNRDLMRQLMELGRSTGVPEDQLFDPDGPMDDGNPLGTPEAEITLRVDTSAYLAQRRAALACHASQVTDAGGFLSMPDAVFAAFFGQEHYIEVGAPAGIRDGWFFA